MSKAAQKSQENAFAGLGDILGDSGLADLVEDAHQQYSMVRCTEIIVKRQDREEFEDDENRLSDLAETIKEDGVVQPVLLRDTVDGLVLIAGERRLRASILAGEQRIPAVIRKMTDEQADRLQFIENIHRKNLTQIEEARRLQRDLDKLGSVDAVLAKYKQNRSWLSKNLGLLKLPEEARRVITENISADLEVINQVKQVEKVDPAAARALVDTLKATRGKVDARRTAGEVLKTVKPKKEKPAAQQVQASQTANFADAKNSTPPVFNPAAALNAIHAEICAGNTPKKALGSLQDADRDEVNMWLYTFYDAGQHAMKGKGARADLLAAAVIKGLASNQFSQAGAGALALVAFLHGADGQAEYDLQAVLKTAASSK